MHKVDSHSKSLHLVFILGIWSHLSSLPPSLLLANRSDVSNGIVGE